MLLIAALLCGCGGDEQDGPLPSVAGKGGAAGSAGSPGKGGAAGASGTAGAEEGGAAGEATAGTGQAGMPAAGTGGMPEPSGYLEPCGECDDPAFPVCAYVLTEDDTPGAYRCTADCDDGSDCTKAGAVCRSDCGGCEKHCAPKVDSITRWLAPCAAGCDFGEAKECALISVGTEEVERCTFACEGDTYTNRCDLIGGTCEPGGLCELFL
jgi:hypothetical protein